MFLPRLILLLTVFGCSLSTNEFERIQGCQQYNSNSGYHAVHPYFDTSTFKNIKTDANGVTRMRIGVLGDKHAAIRFTSVSTESETSMTEIALAHYQNTRTDIRRYPKTILRSATKWDNLGEFHIPNVMDIFKPVMMTVAIHRGGLVTVTRDGDLVPLLQFNDPTFTYKYVGFCKWDVPVVFFYDCPLLVAGNKSETKAVPATGCSRVNKFGVNTCLKVVECSDCSDRDNCFSRMFRTDENDSEVETDLNGEIRCF